MILLKVYAVTWLVAAVITAVLAFFPCTAIPTEGQRRPMAFGPESDMDYELRTR
jgi:hypothetical protein